MPLTLYDLVDRHGNRYSPYGWRVRMALAHKGLHPDVELCSHGDKKLQFSGQKLVPVIVHEGRVVNDSWKIACYLDEAFPDRPVLMDGPQARAEARFINLWADSTLGRPLVRSFYADIFDSLRPDVDAQAFRHAREERTSKTLEELRSSREQDFKEVNHLLAPLNVLLGEQANLAGEKPGYADYIVFGTLQMPLYINGTDPVSKDHKAIHAWRSRLQSQYESLSKPLHDDAAR
jgi:glutathione S-transferase